MKKVKLPFLFILLLSLVTIKASAYDIAVANDDGVTIYYNYTNNGTELEVINSGNSEKKYTGSVVIPEEVTFMNRTRKVTKIGRGAFYENIELSSVTIPNSVTIIGEIAFKGCIFLNSITIPNNNNLTRIENNAFANCTQLKADIVLMNIQYLGEYAFENCQALTSVTIGNSLTCINRFSFCLCSSLQSITIGTGVTSIGPDAFLGCSSLTSLIFPSSVTSIGIEAFRGCTSLTSITIPNSVTSIGSGAFNYIDLPEVISQIENPFAISGKTTDNGSFSKNTYNNGTLYVPAGTKAKYQATEGWKDFLFIEEGTPGGGGGGSKCATPVINVKDGLLEFSCTTPGVQYNYTITYGSGSKSGTADKVVLSNNVTCQVSVYATKAGCTDSDTATKDVELLLSKKGDINADGVVSITDAVSVVNIILNNGGSSAPALQKDDVEVVPE